MAKGDTRAPTRQTFNDEAPPLAAQNGPRRMRYRCFANGCPMPGTIFTGGSDSGVCAWHFGCNADDLPRVSRCIADWECVANAINAGRTFTNDPMKATAAKGDTAELAAMWADLLPSVLGSGWKNRIEPTAGERLGDWTRRLERFLANRIKEALGSTVIADDYAPTPTVADMRSRLRGGLAGPSVGGWE